jgi:hypothetical protein
VDDYKGKLLRKLKTKCSDVNQELIDVNAIYEQSISAFCLEVSSYCKKNNLENPLDKVKEEKKEEDNKTISPEFKSLYRQIAIQTHPDKVEDDVKIEKYQQATEAKKQSKIDKLVSIAKDLKINLNQMKFSDIKTIENSIIDTEKMICQVRNSYVWAWAMAANNKRDDIIFKFVMNNV